MDFTGKIINLMKKNRHSFISGEVLSRELGITRSAVWKRVKCLRTQGYIIEASPSKGYRLLSIPDILSSKEIKDSINHSIQIIGREIYVFQKIDSTNIKGMELGDRGYQEGTIILAEIQSMGRGRLGRSWVSPKGNIYLSVILRPDILPSQAPLITLMAAVASASALRNAFNIEVSIKWPNDLLINGRKVGGILTEMKSEMDRISYIVLGIGINVNMNPSLFPPDIRINATTLKATVGSELSRIEVISSLLKELDKWYKIFLNKGSSAVLDEWQRLSPSLGKRIKVMSLNRIIEGIAEGLDDYGGLIVRLDDGRIEKIVSGDVTVISNCKLQN